MWKRVETLIATMALTLAFGAGAAATGKFATKAEFLDAVAGKSLTTTTKSGKPFNAVYEAGGSGIFTLGSNKPAAFKWTFKGDTLCSVFKTMSFTECNKVEIAGANTVRFIDAKSGRLNNTYSVH